MVSASEEEVNHEDVISLDNLSDIESFNSISGSLDGLDSLI